MKVILALFLFLNSTLLLGQTVSGQIHCKDQAVSFATIRQINGGLGAQCDQDGVFSIELKAGKHHLLIRSQGYLEKEVYIELGTTNQHIQIELEVDPLGLDEIVVSADRGAELQKDATVLVHKIDQRILEGSGSSNLAQGLNFSSGIRVESNCQSCGFTQVRLLGLEGGYSQILFNGRRIFSDVNAMYGLEQIPTEWIDRVEIIRGGGSALYGSNSIAGTINLISLDPVQNEAGIHLSSGLILGEAWTSNISGHASFIHKKRNKGGKLFLSYTHRDALDVNKDSFSDLPRISGINFGFNGFIHHGESSKLSLNVFSWKDDRRGGDHIDLRPDKSRLSEWVSHRVLGGILSNIWYQSEGKIRHQLDLEAQLTRRDSYYGRGLYVEDLGGLNPEEIDSLQKLAIGNYGYLENSLLGGGYQFKYNQDRIKWTFGSDLRQESLVEKQQVYDSLQISSFKNRIEQNQKNIGLYGQFKWIIKTSMVADFGLRYDIIQTHLTQGPQNKGYNRNETYKVFSPKIGLKKDFNEKNSLRFTYSYGFRAPLMYDADLHSSIIDGEVLRVYLPPDLTEERSHSLFLNEQFITQTTDRGVRLNLEAFYTFIIGRFTNETIWEENSAFIQKINAPYLTRVYGANLKMEWIIHLDWRLDMSASLQQAKFDQKIAILSTPDETLYSSDILRSPNMYGSYTLQWQPSSWGIDFSGVLTGPMKVLYQGPSAPPSIRKSPWFFDQNLFLWKSYPVSESTLTLKFGIKNIFNAYQSDLDQGLYRDSDYVYGPMIPRSFHFSLKLH